MPKKRKTSVQRLLADDNDDPRQPYFPTNLRYTWVRGGFILFLIDGHGLAVGNLTFVPTQDTQASAPKDVHGRQTPLLTGYMCDIACPQCSSYCHKMLDDNADPHPCPHHCLNNHEWSDNYCVSSSDDKSKKVTH
jgi:hypothetical protein